MKIFATRLILLKTTAGNPERFALVLAVRLPRNRYI
ncbi:hypothetical protein PANT111_40302 [Pantoea brenneri]|uniref:Uncharacterized protein n=1 Tax=Pantoea brenneri TaxID=472694 RepID=A0AAX3JAY3_9GAMM|nr:hypothetical protein PANT111_40302 [Pantoea brenneri]